MSAPARHPRGRDHVLYVTIATTKRRICPAASHKEASRTWEVIVSENNEQPTPNFSMIRCVQIAAVALAALTLAPTAAADLNCDLSQYKPAEGLTAKIDGDTVSLTWRGERDTDLRLGLGIAGGQPVVAEMAVRPKGGGWTKLAGDLSPEFHVTSGVRRISEQQLRPLRALGVEITPEVIEKEKWVVFWDSPLTVPGLEGTNPGLPRSPEEIRRATSSFQTTGCSVKTDGARLEVSFPGFSLGIFSGRLQYTVYRGSNLVRQEAIAKTDEPSVAYKYAGGLTGFRTADAPRVVWRDTSSDWQKYEFGGSPNSSPVALRSRNRLAIVETEGGSIAVFPPPHKFFFAREIEMNLGYVWYRKDDEESFSVGVRHGDREEMFRPYGVSTELWQARIRQSRRFAEGNFALYNAPPGTEQRMAVYFYLSQDGPRDTLQQVLAYTHDDFYKPLPGYKVATSHFHTHFSQQLRDAGTLDLRPPWLPAFRARGINIAMMSDFHSDGHPSDPGPIRLAEMDSYFEACRRHSDRDFLLMPGEEANVHVGGHYTIVFPKPVYWTKVRGEGQAFAENHPHFGKVYHTGSIADMLRLMTEEQALVWQAHPRTKGSTHYPDVIKDTDHFRSDRYLGVAFKNFPVDNSEKRMCEYRCLDTLDDMNNWGDPKYLFAEGDTYTKFPEDEIYGEASVNYIKVDRVPLFDEDWSPIFNALRRGEFFVTTGEVLIPNYTVEGSGSQRKVVADVEWTFPLEFAEVVWGDGKKTGREVISATGRAPFSREKFEIPFDATGKKWVRFAVWDSAGNGAITQPVHLKPSGTSD